MNVFRAAAAILAFDGDWRKASKDQDGASAHGRIMDSSAEALRADVDVYDHALWLAREAGIAVRHGQRYHLAVSELICEARELACIPHWGR